MDETQVPIRGGGTFIWKVVAATMFFTIASGLLWHESLMLERNREYDHEILLKEQEITVLTGYRDALVAGGMASGTRFLQSSTTEPYGI